MAIVEFRIRARSNSATLDAGDDFGAALQPGDFEYTHGSLHHVPSRHRFLFDRFGRVAIDAACGCATMAISRADRELVGAFETGAATTGYPSKMNPGVRRALQQTKLIGPAHARDPDGLSALCAPRRPRHNCRHDGTHAVGDARGIGLVVSTLSSAVLLLTLGGAASFEVFRPYPSSRACRLTFVVGRSRQLSWAAIGQPARASSFRLGLGFPKPSAPCSPTGRCNYEFVRRLS